METETPPEGRQWAGKLPRYGIASAYGGGPSGDLWKFAIDAYYWDQLEKALELASGLGVTFGWQEWMFRLIEAEAVTRQVSDTIQVDPQVSLEHVPAQLHHISQVTADVAHATADVRRRFGWAEGANTLVSILAEETNAPWTVGRAGYMMDKYPYDKICLPRVSTHNPIEFQSVVRHEYAHVMVLNLSEAKAATWLHESVTMVAQDWMRTEDWGKFAHGTEHWLQPAALNAAFNDEHDPKLFHARSLAYSQSSALGFYLKSIGGEPKIGDLLRGFADNTNWTELKMTLTGQTPADEALREVYGFGEKELFDRALVWLRSK